jgi:type IV pilus assembly protein PilO
MAKNEVGIAELEIKEIGSWPLQYRAAVLVAIFGATIFLCYILLLKSNFDKLYSFQAEQKKMLASFAEQYQQSANLDGYKKQMVEIQKILQLLLQRLPSKGEIPVLLEDISQQALSAGLTFELIKPEDPIDKEFYVEQPIQMILIGKYHGFGRFAEGISKLPRIVTLHDFSIIKRNNGDNKENQDAVSILTMKIYAKTYWYVSKETL